MMWILGTVVLLALGYKDYRTYKAVIRARQVG